MRILGGLLAFAVVVFLLVNFLNRPAYYICSGTKTPQGQPPQPIQRVGLEIETTPMLDRLLFQSKNVGMLILEQIDVLEIKDDSAGIVSIVDSNGAYAGQFARISRHLDVSAIGGGYDLYCNQTTLAPI